MAGSGSTIQISRGDLQTIAERGAHSHRGGDAFCRAAVLRRLIAGYLLSIKHSDPRQTKGLSPAGWEVAIRKLHEPWRLRELEIEELPKVLARSPGLREALVAAGVDVEEFLAQVGELSFPELLALVDAAICEQSATAARREDDDSSRNAAHANL